MTPALDARPAPEGIHPIRDSEFDALRAFIYHRTGIHLSSAKKALLVGRLSRRLRQLGLPTFGAYYRLVTEGGDAAEATRLLEAICTHETHFFREPRQFEFIESRILPAWEAQAAAGEKPRRVRAWSAGCSTGEEPYSVAMLLLARLPPSWSVEVLATDLSTRALDSARRAVWPLAKAAEIPVSYLRTFMLKGTETQQGLMKVGPTARAAVRFQRHNLSEAADHVEGPFDLILCRNVLIYFDATSRTQAIQRLTRQLSPHGFLFLGHAETLNGMASPLRSVGPTVYAWPPDATGTLSPQTRGPHPR